MCLRRLFLLTLFGLTTLCLQAQDVHYTLHNYSPLWLNPANTGNFRGTVRVGGVYRGQWHTLEGIRTPSVLVDAPLPFALRKQDWIGVGVSLVNDRATFDGAGNTRDQPLGADLITNFFGFSAAYHFALTKDRQNVITLGAQYGSVSYGGEFAGSLVQELNIPTAQGGGGQGNEFMASQMSMGGQGNNNNLLNFNDLNVGVRAKFMLDEDKGNLVEAGVSLLHVTSPRRNTIFEQAESADTMAMGGQRAEDRARTLHAHARADIELSEKWRFQPTVFYQQTPGTSSATIQAWGQTDLKRDLGLRLGLGYRTGDALQALVGLNFGQIRAAFAYDITIASQLSEVTNGNGAFELGLAYIFNIYKKPTVTPTILCPEI